MTQLSLAIPGSPVHLDLAEVAKQPTGHSAVALCASKAGKLDKIVAADLDIQESVWSRVKSGQNSLSLESLDALMTTCGNELPLHWLLLRRGYDPRSLRRIETDVERENRELREQLAAMAREREIERRTVRDFIGGRAAA